MTPEGDREDSGCHVHLRSLNHDSRVTVDRMLDEGVVVIDDGEEGLKGWYLVGFDSLTVVLHCLSF